LSINVKIHGSLSKTEVQEIYKNSQFILVPSKNEGFPKVIGEAMNFGCVPIVSDVSCISQYVKNDYNGFLIQTNTIENLYCLLLHRPKDLMGASGEKLINSLYKIKSSGLVKKIGISIYSFDDIDWILKKFKFDIIQLPFNLLDQRLIKNKWLKKLKSHKLIYNILTKVY
jgi:glycosyltransferase involved in cell wall biosynthesis